MGSVTKYTHVQETPATEWTINHRLNTLAPVIDVWIDVDGVSTKILPRNITVQNANTVIVTFSSPRPGRAGIR